jgi:hypothetical protein
MVCRQQYCDGNAGINAYTAIQIGGAVPLLHRSFWIVVLCLRVCCGVR